MCVSKFETCSCKARAGEATPGIAYYGTWYLCVTALRSSERRGCPPNQTVWSLRPRKISNTLQIQLGGAGGWQPSSLTRQLLASMAAGAASGRCRQAIWAEAAGTVGAVCSPRYTLPPHTPSTHSLHTLPPHTPSNSSISHRYTLPPTYDRVSVKRLATKPQTLNL